MITVLLIDQSACFSLSLPAYIFWFAASRALSSIFAIWQAMQICNSPRSSAQSRLHSANFASRVRTAIFCKFASSVRMDG